MRREGNDDGDLRFGETDEATFGEAMLVAREKELGMERPSQIRNKKFAGQLGKSVVATDLVSVDVV